MPFRNSTWGPGIIRVFGALNILFAAVGFYFLGESAPRTIARVHNSADQPCVREVYWTMTVIELCCLLALAIGGVYLLRLKRRGLVVSNFVFAAEIAWFFGTTALALTLGMAGGQAGLLGMSTFAAGGIGGMGTAPQILTAYPLWALVALNLLRGRFPDGPIQSG